MIAEQPEPKKNIRLVNQGTYGCVFRPGLTCEGMVDESTKQITKIQKEKETSESEVYIGEKIQQIANYSRYFAPVLENCEVDIHEIEDNELQKCDFIDTDRKSGQPMKYEMNKIPYVGKNTLGDYIQQLLERNMTSNQFTKYFINSYKILLQGLHKLNVNGIVHYDIKENNIMCRDVQKRPIIIDFGLSFVAEEALTLETNKIFDVLYAHAPQYAPWCIDIDILSYIVNVVGKSMESAKEISQLPASIELIEKEIDNYYEKNTGINDVLDMKQIEAIKEKLKTYFSGLITKVGFGTTKWEKVMVELLSYHSTWDAYSLTVCYLQFITELQIDYIIVDVPFMDEFKQMLLEVIHAVPNERKTAKQILDHLKKIQVVPSEDLKKITSNLTEFNQKEGNIANRREQFVDFKIKSQERYEEIAKK